MLNVDIYNMYVDNVHLFAIYSDSKFIAKTMKQTGMQSVSVCVHMCYMRTCICICVYARIHVCKHALFLNTFFITCNNAFQYGVHSF